MMRVASFLLVITSIIVIIKLEIIYFYFILLLFDFGFFTVRLLESQSPKLDIYSEYPILLREV
jgi:hypothetical protein